MTYEGDLNLAVTCEGDLNLTVTYDNEGDSSLTVTYVGDFTWKNIDFSVVIDFRRHNWRL